MAGSWLPAPATSLVHADVTSTPHDAAIAVPPSLTQLAVEAAAQQLLFHRDDVDAAITYLQRVPEPELARDIWQLCERRCQADDASDPPQALLQALAAVFWQLLALDVAQPRAPWALTWAGRNLQHLHLADSQAANLHWIAGLRQLQCLSLRGCAQLPTGALASLAPLQHLQSLDLAGLPLLQDAALAVALAALPQLVALNVGHTAAGDATLAAVTYAHRAAAWSREHGEPVPEQQRGWRPSLLRQLRLEQTAVTSEGVGHLLALPALHFLDIRGTAALQHGVLHKLARRFSLQVIQGGVLASSPALAVAAVNQVAVTCLCGHHPPGGGFGDWRDRWSADGIAQLAEAARVGVGDATAVHRKAARPDDDSQDGSSGAATPMVAPGFRRPRRPRPGQADALRRR